MKKILFLATFLMIASSYTFAQNDNPRERRTETKDDRNRERSLHNFAKQVSQLSLSKVPTNAKQERLMVLIGEYMSNYRSPQGEKELNDLLEMIEGADTKKKDDIKRAMWNLKKKIAKHKLEQEDRRSKGVYEDYTGYCLENDNACIIAARLYREIGTKNLANKLDCRGNCDFDKTRDPKSRGASDDEWVYTGTRKFFTEDEMFGWRYLCRKESADERNGLGRANPIDGIRSREESKEDEEEIIRDRANPNGMSREEAEKDAERRAEDMARDTNVLEDDGAVFSDDLNYGPVEYAWKKDINVDRW